MQGLLQWLGGLPPFALYAALVFFAALENFFPPAPADTIVAFGSFIAAQGEGTALGSFLSTWFGNAGGAMVVYALGRRYGAERLERRLAAPGTGAVRLQALYSQYGLVALFLSRFLPGVRALVPPFAGAARLRALPVALMIGTASAIWYGFITWVGFHLGRNWTEIVDRIQAWQRTAALAAGLAVVLMVALLLVVRRLRSGGE